MPRAVVIGAGLSGLACAFHLHRAGVPVTLLDAGDAPGGNLRTRIVPADFGDLSGELLQASLHALDGRAHALFFELIGKR